MSYDYSRNDQFLRKINIIILIVVYLFTEYPKDFTLQGKYCSEILCLFADDSSFIPLQKKESQLLCLQLEKLPMSAEHALEKVSF